MSSDTISIYDSYSYLNWYSKSEEYMLAFSTLGNEYYFKTVKELILEQNPIKYTGSEIAIGSVEFVESILNKNLKPINIPSQLMKNKYTGRWVGNVSRQQLLRQLDKYKELFIKDSITVKRFDPAIIRSEGDISFDSEVYFASEVIDIESEWRAFIFRNKIIDCKQYIGNYTDTIDNNILKSMVAAWTNSPSAYTLDIAKLKNGNTVIIEAHNFISCGLYGFEHGNKLALMSSIAYNEEKITKSW